MPRKQIQKTLVRDSVDNIIRLSEQTATTTPDIVTVKKTRKKREVKLKEKQT